MDFIDEIRNLAEKALDLKDQLHTEEATKTALVMPFIRILGYDVFNPREVVPEFTADMGTKKGERVDYAIMREEKPVMLIECKVYGRNLDAADTSQLYRYFSVTDARFGLLTNGALYRFYADLEQPNKMDSKPFLEFDLLDIREPLVEELKKFAKMSFDIENILATAAELKYAREIRRILSEEYNRPTEDFVRLFTARVYPGHKTQAVIGEFTPIVKRAFHQFINDRISDRLKSALREEAAAEESEQVEDPVEVENHHEKKRIITTEEEYQAYYIVKAILRSVVDVRRIALRDRISYCGILLDDNNRKPICRLYFNSANKYLGIFDASRDEEKIPIQELDDIYQHAEQLKEAVSAYEPAI